GFGGGGNTNEAPYIVFQIVEPTKKVQGERLQKDLAIRVHHKFEGKNGQGSILRELTSFTKVVVVKEKTIPEKYRERTAQIEKNEKAAAEDWIKHAIWCLEHGLVDSCAKAMEKAQEKERDNPKVVLFAKVKTDLDAPLPLNSQVADNWCRK